MNRRTFLQSLFGVAAATTTAYFLPPIGGWHSDVIARPRCIADCININGGTLPPEALETYFRFDHNGRNSPYTWLKPFENQRLLQDAMGLKRR